MAAAVHAGERTDSERGYCGAATRLREDLRSNLFQPSERHAHAACPASDTRGARKSGSESAHAASA